jgi:hypothetical protein
MTVSNMTAVIFVERMSGRYTLEDLMFPLMEILHHDSERSCESPNFLDLLFRKILQIHTINTKKLVEILLYMVDHKGTTTNH